MTPISEEFAPGHLYEEWYGYVTNNDREGSGQQSMKDDLNHANFVIQSCWIMLELLYLQNGSRQPSINRSMVSYMTKNAKESWALIEDFALYDNESWNDPRDFVKPVKAISLPQDVPHTSNCRLIELENQVQRLGEAHLAPKPSVQVKKNHFFRRRNKRRAPNVVEPELRTIVEVAPMADNQTMEELLQAPTFEETFGEAWKRFKEMLRACPHHGLMELTQIDTFYNGLNENDQDSLNVAAGENLLSKTTREALHIIENKSKVRYSRNKQNVSRMNTTSRENASKTDDRIDKLADKISTLVDIFAKKVVTPATVKAVEESCVTCGGNHAYYNCDATNSNKSSLCAATGTYNQVARQNRASNHMAPPGFAPETTDKEQTNFQGSTTHIQPPVVPIPEPDVPKTLPKPNIPYPSRLNDQKLRKKATNQMEKFFQIFQDFHFDISFTDALLLMPKFASTIKSLLANKDKLFELAKIPLNENCSAMLLKKLPEKLGDPGKFLIPFDFPGMDEILLRIDHALIDVYGEEITLRLNDEAVTFNLNQTTRYSSTYDDMPVNRIDVIDVAREAYAQEMLGFSNNSLGGNPTSTSEPIIFDSSPSLNPFEGSDFILEEIKAYHKDESISPEIDHVDCDPEGDICLIEKLLNDDPLQLPPMDLKQGEVAKAKSSTEEPPKLD
uniref:Reverse transcriptase domain-containing protein n=1 Tax=Tanacetum cinerariifolium TaxID=118510 RepID=A0A6L2J8U5_TANCI|nr:reverse transcriptase domain-containing protein [Tanacetum cinerariifolium]